jgi:TRAP-type C4-dicarboxylate transport system substrate-binding protein
MFTKTLCTSLADFKKLKVRSETSDIKIDMINCWASATPLAMSEIYTSLSTGVLDGCENTLSGLRNNNWYEQVKYVYETEHVIGTSVILVSEKVWQQLSESERQIISDAMKEACDWFQVETEKQISENKAFLVEKGVVFTPCTDKQAWIDSCAPLYEKYAAGVQDFIKEIQSYK